jgi:hypothetical protein
LPSAGAESTWGLAIVVFISAHLVGRRCPA